MSHEGGSYGEGAAAEAEAVAAVACVLIVAGPFRTIAMAAGAGEVEKRCAVHLDICLETRKALLAGFDRSIVEKYCEWRLGGNQGRKKGLKKERCLRMAQLFYVLCCCTIKKWIVRSGDGGGGGGVVVDNLLYESLYSICSGIGGSRKCGEASLLSCQPIRGPISGKHLNLVRVDMSGYDWI
jgi:hypothetical protein